MIIYVILWQQLLRAVVGQGTCGPDGTCQASVGGAYDPVRELSGSFCGLNSVTEPSTSASLKDLYRHGGSAQAYKPNAPVSSTVCSLQVAKGSKYKASSWPFTRRTTGKGTAPTMNVTFQLWSCKPKEGQNTTCICSPLYGLEGQAVVEVWQSRPDGRYSSLKDSEDECRATVPIDHQGIAKFSTVAPGSTGIMGGLGPRGWENSPYGSPILHTLVRAPRHAPLLLDISALPHHKTLKERKFSMSWLDWRGIAWSRYATPSVPYGISSWIPNKERKHIDIAVDIFLELAAEDKTPQVEFCPSLLYLLPGTFFLEPITMCARSLLDFFSL